MIQLSKENKNLKCNSIGKNKYSTNEIKENDMNLINNDKNNPTIKNIIYSKRLISDRKKIQFKSPIPNSTSGIKTDQIPNKDDNIGNNIIFERGGSQVNILARKDSNHKISGRIHQINKNIKKIYTEKEEIKTIYSNHNNSNFLRRTKQKIIPNGIKKKN